MTKKLINTILISCFVIPVMGQEAYWLGDNSAADETGNGHTLTAYNSAGYSTTAVQGTHSMNLDLAEGNYFGLTGFSLGDPGTTIIFSFQNWNGSGVRTMFDNGGIKIYANLSSKTVAVETDNGSLVDYATSNASMWTAGDWVHVGVRFMDVSGYYATIWINGVNQTADSSVRNDWPTSGNIYIGNSTELSQTFYGKIDNMAVYRCALSDAQMDELYDNRTAEYTVTCPSGGTPITGDKMYFSNSGSDSNDGLTPSTPKATEAAIKTAIASLGAGDTIFLACGSTWTSVDLNLNGISGSSGIPAVITSYGTGNKPILKGTSVFSGFTKSGNVWNKTDAAIQGKVKHYIDAYTGSSNDQWYFTYFLGNIFVGGAPYYVGRYPNNTASLSAESVDAVNNDDITDSDATWTTNQWANGWVMIGLNDWIRDKAQIYSNSSNNLVFNSSDLNTYVWGNMQNGLKYGIMNHAATLDQNGEYFHDYSNNRIYIYWDQSILPTVEIPVVDSIINIQSCSYVVIDGLNIVGSRVYGIKVRGGSNITIKNCETSYCGYAGIWGTGYSGLTLQYNYSHDNNNNIYVNDPTNTTITGNICKRANLTGTLDDDDINCGVNIGVNQYNGTTMVEYNYCDSSDYTGITFRDYTSRTSPGYTCRYNLIQNWGMISSDVGGIYTVSNDDNVEKLIYGNILWGANTTTGWELGDGIVSGIYIDNVSRYTRVENNLVYDVPAEIFINYDGDYTTMINNTLVRSSLADNQYARGGLYTDWGNSSSYMVLTGNLFVSHTSATPAINWNGYDNSGAGWEWQCTECSFGLNKYASAYTSSIFRHREEWSNEVNLTLSQWQSATGMDGTSTFKGSTELGALNYTFANWSGGTHDYNLGSTAVYQDYDGNVYSGTLTLAPYTHKVLFYISGDRTGLVAGVYSEMVQDVPEEPQPPTVKTRLKRFLNTTEQNGYLNAVEQYIYLRN